MRTMITRLTTVAVTAPLALTLLAGTGHADSTPVPSMTPVTAGAVEISGIVSFGPALAPSRSTTVTHHRTFGPHRVVRGLGRR